MKINVVVCTYNRSEGLRVCLESLRRQTARPEDYGVLVVDNGSTDDTGDVVGRLKVEMPNLRYHFDPVPDVAAARNRGLELTECDLVGYIDDDEEVAPDWVARMLAAFEQQPPEVAAVGGDLDPVWEVPRPDWLTDSLVQYYSVNLDWSTTPRLIVDREWLPEGNVTFRVAHLRAFGGFPATLGRKGHLLLSGENFVMDLMMESGLQLYYDPTIRAKHFIPAARMTKTWLRRRMFWGGVTAAELRPVAEPFGVKLPYWHHVDVPQSPADWLAILSDDGDPATTTASLQSMHHLGYLLGLAGVIIGR